MRILVTGGLGFVGSNFCRRILAERTSFTITNLDKMGIGSNLANLKDLKSEKRYNFVKGDIRNSKVVNRIIKQVDAVVNFAAETHVDRSIADPESFVQNNAIGAFTILEAIRKNNREVKFVQVSTDEVYGEKPEGSFRENDPLRPSNPYSASKAASDMFALAYYKTYDLNLTVTRCTNNFGPYQFPEKFMPKTIIRAYKNLEIPVYGTGKNIRDWIHVQDHCKAIDLVLNDGEPGEIYNVSSGNELTNVEIVKKILSTLGRPEDLITFVDDRPGHDLRYSLDSSKIRAKLGWKPKYLLGEALSETVNWYMENDWWWKPIVTAETLHSTPWKLGGKN